MHLHCYNCNEAARVTLARTRKSKTEITRQWYCGACDYHWSTQETIRSERGNTSWMGKGLSDEYLTARHIRRNGKTNVRKGRRAYTEGSMQKLLMGEPAKPKPVSRPAPPTYYVQRASPLSVDKFQTYDYAMRHAHRINGVVWHEDMVARATETQIFIKGGRRNAQPLENPYTRR